MTKNDWKDRLLYPILTVIAFMMLVGYVYVSSMDLLADEKTLIVDQNSQATQTSTLKRYEWFLETIIDIEKTKAEIIRHTWHISALRVLYYLDSTWPAQDIERYNVWSNELVDLNKKYSELVSEYNSQMEKANCFFGKKENLPERANLILPCKFSFTKKEKNASPLSL